MLKQEPTQDLPRPRWQPSAAQVLIFVLVIICGLVVYNAYQQAHEPPPDINGMLLKGVTPAQKRYEKQVELWRQKLAANDMKLLCPYLGQRNVARIDLPSKTPITLEDWDAHNEALAARQAYNEFVKVRVAARLPKNQPPELCIIHLFDVDGNEVARASADSTTTI